jgi:hypothetical protein
MNKRLRDEAAAEQVHKTLEKKRRTPSKLIPKGAKSNKK